MNNTYFENLAFKRARAKVQGKKKCPACDSYDCMCQRQLNFPEFKRVSCQHCDRLLKLHKKKSGVWLGSCDCGALVKR